MTTLHDGLTGSQRGTIIDYDPFGIPAGMDEETVGTLDPLSMERAYLARECIHSSLSDALAVYYPDVQSDDASYYTIAEVRSSTAPFTHDRPPNGNEAIKREWKYLVSTLPEDAKIQVVGEKAFVKHDLVGDNSLLTVYDLSEAISDRKKGLKIERMLQVGDDGNVLDMFSLAGQGTEVYLKRHNIVVRFLKGMFGNRAYADTRLDKHEDGSHIPRITTYSLDGFTNQAMLHEIEHSNHIGEILGAEDGSGKLLDIALSTLTSPIGVSLEAIGYFATGNLWYLAPYVIAQLMLYFRSRNPNTYIGKIHHKKVGFERRSWMGMELLRMMLENNGFAMSEAYVDKQTAKFSSPVEHRGGSISARYQPLLWVLIDRIRGVGRSGTAQPQPGGATALQQNYAF